MTGDSGVTNRRVTRAVVWNQLLWTAGYALTTGGFLTYFANELGDAERFPRTEMAFLIALLLVIPEIAGVIGLCTGSLIRRVENRKVVFVACSLLSRVISVGIPLLAIPQFRPTIVSPLWCLAILLAVTQAIQTMAYLSYLSWLSDLMPRQQWGKLFASQNIAKLSILLVVPLLAGYWRDTWRYGVRVGEIPEDQALFAYLMIFLIGIGLQTLSILPLLRLPNVIRLPNANGLRLESRRDVWHEIRSAFRNRDFRWLLGYSWCLSFANGLTQAVFFQFIFYRLSLSLFWFYALLCTMRVVKIPVSAIAGYASDHRGDKSTLFWSVVMASLAMPVWFVAERETWWLLFVAYALWGSFAAANITGRNLALKLAPPSENATHLAMFRQIAGLLAGVSGLLGGLWLGALSNNKFQINLAGFTLDHFRLLFLVSFLGRIGAAFFVLPIREPGEETGGD